MIKEQLESELNRACDIMRRDNNCGGVMEYIEHLSWVLFLKFYDEQEKEFENQHKIFGKNYKPIIDGKYKWSEWVPKALGVKTGTNGKRATPKWDADRTMQYVRGELIPHLASLTGSPEREIIAGIFGDRNVIVCASAYNLKDVISIIDDVNFTSQDDIHTVSHFYEMLLKKLGNENKLAGEFYTPRPVIRFIIDVIDPKMGETVYDPACGTCGFLTEAYEYMRQSEHTTKDYKTLQQKTFFGNEKKAVPALLGLLNMVLHGVMTPQIRRRNTLEENIRNLTERFDVVITNPPFGGTENQQIQQNFPVKVNATELLFIEHVMKKLKSRDGSRCGMVVPEGTLFRLGAFATVKEQLLKDFDLFLVVSLPPGTFAPYSDVKTALMFFSRPGPTKEVLYYELPLPEGYKKFSKGKPIGDEHFDEAREVWKKWNTCRESKKRNFKLTDNAWVEPVKSLIGRGYDLSPQNPNISEAEKFSHPAEITARLLERNRQLQSMLESLHAKVSNGDNGNA